MTRPVPFNFRAGRIAAGWAIVCAIGAFGLAPAAQSRPAQAPKPPAPRLIVTRLIIHGLGHNPYLVVPHSGRVPNIRVTVVTTNIGRAAAPPSTTWVVLADNRHMHSIQAMSLFAHVRVGALAPGRSQTGVGVLKQVQPQLGLSRVEAGPDLGGKIQPNTPGDRRTSPAIPVIARTWDVNLLTTHLSGQFGVTDQTAKALLGFYFRFQRLDVMTGRFIYTASGAVSDAAAYDESLRGCTGNGSDSANHAPWPVATSNFNLSFGLDKYLGTVAASSEPTFTIPITCPDGSKGQVPAKMLDMRIGFGRPQPLWPYSTRIRSGTTIVQGLYVVSYQWSLKADVP